MRTAGPAMHRHSRSDLALAAMLFLGDLFFLSCLVGLGRPEGLMQEAPMSGQPISAVLLSD